MDNASGLCKAHQLITVCMVGLQMNYDKAALATLAIDDMMRIYTCWQRQHSKHRLSMQTPSHMELQSSLMASGYPLLPDSAASQLCTQDDSQPGRPPRLLVTKFCIPTMTADMLNLWRLISLQEALSWSALIESTG